MRSYSENKDYHIYTLSDPETSQVRYVGCTMNPKSRLSAHLLELTSKEKAKWISDLRAKGLKPIMNIIHTVTDITEAAKIELDVYKKYDSSLLTCVNPAKRKYVNNAASPRLTLANRSDVSLYVIENIKKLMALNNLSVKGLAKHTGLTEGVICRILNGTCELKPYDIQRITRSLSANQSRMILPNQTFKFNDDPNPLLTNRV